MPKASQKPFRLGRYEALRLIAAGGMAELYLGRHRIAGIERLVVLKRVLPNLVGNKRFVTMFIDEARILASLHHANIVQILDVGIVDGSPYLAMEALKGRDVHTIQRAAKGRNIELGIDHALTIAIEVAAALHYAHDARGKEGKPLEIVHNDVSPHNIFVTYDGTVKLMDFGVAKATSKQGRTKHGVIKGKLAYIAPEKYLGKDVDRRGDIFSLGVVLWEMTTGRRLYKREGELRIMQAVVESEPDPPSKFVKDYPPELERIVLKALSRDPADRQASAQEVQSQLEEFAREKKLAASRLGLSRLMNELFAVEVEGWAKAQETGNYDALIDKLVEELRSGQTLHGETVSLFDLDLDALSESTRRDPMALLDDDTVLDDKPPVEAAKAANRLEELDKDDEDDEDDEDDDDEEDDRHLEGLDQASEESDSLDDERLAALRPSLAHLWKRYGAVAIVPLMAIVALIGVALFGSKGQLLARPPLADPPATAEAEAPREPTLEEVLSGGPDAAPPPEPVALPAPEPPPPSPSPSPTPPPPAPEPPAPRPRAPARSVAPPRAEHRAEAPALRPRPQRSFTRPQPKKPSTLTNRELDALMPR